VRAYNVPPDPLVGWGGGRRILPPHFSPTRRLWHRGSVVGAQGNERAMMVNAYLDPRSCQKLASHLILKHSKIVKKSLIFADTEVKHNLYSKDCVCSSLVSHLAISSSLSRITARQTGHTRRSTFLPVGLILPSITDFIFLLRNVVINT